MKKLIFSILLMVHISMRLQSEVPPGEFSQLFEKCNYTTLDGVHKAIPCREKGEYIEKEAKEAHQKRGFFKRVLGLFFQLSSPLEKSIKLNLQGSTVSQATANRISISLLMHQDGISPASADLIQDLVVHKSGSIAQPYVNLVNQIDQCIKQSAINSSDKTLSGRFDYASIMLKHLLQEEKNHEEYMKKEEEDHKERMQKIKNGSDENFKKDLANYRASLNNQNTVAATKTE